MFPILTISHSQNTTIYFEYLYISLRLNTPGLNEKNKQTDKRWNYKDVEICSVHFILKSYIPVCVFMLVIASLFSQIYPWAELSDITQP